MKSRNTAQERETETGSRRGVGGGVQGALGQTRLKTLPCCNKGACSAQVNCTGSVELRRGSVLGSRPPPLTRQQSTVQVEGFEVDQVAEPFGDPASQPEVVGKVEVLQAVQVAQALGHLSLRDGV